MLLSANLATPLYAVWAKQFGYSTVVLALIFAVYALVLIPALDTQNLALLGLLTALVLLASCAAQLVVRRGAPPALAQAAGLMLLASGLLALVFAAPAHSMALLVTGAVLTAGHDGVGGQPLLQARSTRSGRSGAASEGLAVGGKGPPGLLGRGATGRTGRQVQAGRVWLSALSVVAASSTRRSAS